MKLSKKLSVTIGIPAYNAEQNISRLLQSLETQQTKNVSLKAIIVLSDASCDNTVSVAASVISSKIKIISNRKRKGFAFGVKKILSLCTSDVVVLLNDDIVINDTKFIEKLTAPFLTDRNIGLVGGRIEPLPARTFASYTAQIGHTLMQRSIHSLKNPNNKLTCDGKVLALSKSFYSSINFPAKLNETGNLDAYLYFLCHQKAHSYRYAPRAKVFFKFEDTIGEFLKYSLRNAHSTQMMNEHFHEMEIQEEKPSKPFYSFVRSSEWIRFAPSLILLFVTNHWITYKLKKNSNFSQVWNVIESTKRLENI